MFFEKLVFPKFVFRKTVFCKNCFFSIVTNLEKIIFETKICFSKKPKMVFYKIKKKITSVSTSFGNSNNETFVVPGRCVETVQALLAARIEFDPLAFSDQGN